MAKVNINNSRENSKKTKMSAAYRNYTSYLNLQ
jgi:hypothetical protein